MLFFGLHAFKLFMWMLLSFTPTDQDFKMRFTSSLGWTVAALAAFSSTAHAAPLPAGYTCVGSSLCGTMGADGVVTAPPTGPSYGFVATQPLAGNSNGHLGLGQENSSSVAHSPLFNAVAGDNLNFYFNYVTSDGAGFADYGWVRLVNSLTNDKTVLFTARTTPSGNTVPGFNMPGLAPGVVLSPFNTPIIPGAPAWSALGSSSGRCYSTGCGYTGWIKMDYILASAGSYYLEFGAVNWSDSDFQSGLAFDGVKIGNDVIGVPEPASIGLAGLALLGLAAARRRRQH